MSKLYMHTNGVYSEKKPFPWWLVFVAICLTAYFAKPLQPEKRVVNVVRVEVDTVFVQTKQPSQKIKK